MKASEHTEVTITIPRHEADQLAMTLGEVLLATGSCCRCTSPEAFQGGIHNWRTDPRLLRDLYNQLRHADWQEL